MTLRPLLLDLFCGAGGASMGYHRAGFDVVGIDIAPQPNYPFTFIRADAMSALASIVRHGALVGYGGPGYRFDAIHASPPCQHYSYMSACRPGLAARYPNLVAPVRDSLIAIGRPYVIENVPGAPMIEPITLCGMSFGTELYRHRLFESNVKLAAPEHRQHVIPASKAGHWRPGTIMSVSGHVAPVAHARRIMGIDWTTRAELAESIPPSYTEFVGRQLIAHIGAS